MLSISFIPLINFKHMLYVDTLRLGATGVRRAAEGWLG